MAAHPRSCVFPQRAHHSEVVLMPKGSIQQVRQRMVVKKRNSYRHSIDEVVKRNVSIGGVKEVICFEISVVSAILEAETQNSVASRCRLSHFKCNSGCIVNYDCQ